MKKIVCLLLLAVLLVTSCTFKSYEDGAHIIDEVAQSYSVGDTIYLTVRDKNGNTVPNTDVLWSSSDFNVASVTGEGSVRVNGEGLCHIVARDRENMQYYSQVEIFCPYSTVISVEETVADADEKLNDQMLSSFLETMASRYGMMLAKKYALGALNVASFLISIGWDFLTKDQYWYSSSEIGNELYDGILYTVTDWTNEPCSFSENDITPEKLFSHMSRFYAEGTVVGDTYADFSEELKYRLSRQIPNNGVYHLDKMDDKYEYRVVIRGDVKTCYIYDYYSNGALDVLGSALNEIESWTLEDLSDFAYTVNKCEILTFDNLRICVEIREKR